MSGIPISQFAVFFLLLLTGFFCKKYGLFTDSAVSAINMFIINISYPCLILTRTVALDMDHQIFANFMLAFSINFGLLLLFGVYSWLYCRGGRFPGEDKPVAEFSMAAPNNGFMGFPVALTFFGDFGLLYMVACNISLNIYFFTYGVMLLKRGRGVPGEPILKKVLGMLKMLAHPKISAAVLGIILCYNNVVLPGIATDYLSGVGGIASPLAMISIGTMLAGNFGIHSFKRRVVMEPVANKLFAMPLISAAVVWFLPLDPLVKVILIIANTLPTATTVPILCDNYARNKGLSGEILVITTLLSIATVPFAVWILNLCHL